MITGLIKSGFNEMFKYHQDAIAFARTAGLSAKQADAQTSVLTRRTKELAMAYGITSKEVLELQKNIAAATGKAYLLNDREAERQIQINKLVGSEVSNQFASEMMQHMGGQLSAVQGAVSKAYATAAKSGLNAAQFSEKVAKNLSLANKLSFREGVNGIIKMVALSEKLGFNLQAVEAAANNFMELDKAIENSARLQMLGGSAGAYGSNPLTMAYEANYDPEAFTERMTDMLKGLARFDRKQGVAVVNGMNRDIVKSIAQGMGIGFEEAMTIAKKQSEMTYKKEAYGARLGNFTKEQQDFILNKSYVDPSTGALMINDAKGQQYNISNGGLSTSVLEDMMQFNGLSDTDLLAEQARSLTSIQEMIAGRKESAFATIAEKAKEYLPMIKSLVDFVTKELFNTILPNTLGVMENVGSWIMNNKGWLKSTVEGVLSVLRFIFVNTAKYFKTIIAIMIGWKVAKWFGKLPLKGGTVGSTLRDFAIRKLAGGGGGGSPAAAAITGGGGGSAAAPLKNAVLSKTSFAPSTGRFANIRDYGRYVRGNYSALRETGKGRFSSFWSAAKGPKVGSKGGITNALGKNMGKMSSDAAKSTFAKNAIKGASRVKYGAAVGIGAGLAGAGINYLVDKGLESGSIQAGGVRHTLGRVGGTAAEYAAMGSMFGPWGTVIGGVAGAAKGYYDAYKDWKNLPENANKGLLSFVTKQCEGFFNTLAPAIDAITGFFKSVGNIIHKNVSKVIKWLGFKTSDQVEYSNSKKGFDTGGIVGGTSFTGDKVTANVNSGEMILTRSQQSSLFSLINNLPIYLEATRGKTAKPASSSTINIYPQVNDVQTKLLSEGRVNAVSPGSSSTTNIYQQTNDVQTKPLNEGRVNTARSFSSLITKIYPQTNDIQVTPFYEGSVNAAKPVSSSTTNIYSPSNDVQTKPLSEGRVNAVNHASPSTTNIYYLTNDAQTKALGDSGVNVAKPVSSSTTNIYQQTNDVQAKPLSEGRVNAVNPASLSTTNIYPQVNDTQAKPLSEGRVNASNSISSLITKIYSPSNDVQVKPLSEAAKVKSGNVVPPSMTSILTQTNDVQAKPVGEKEYIYKPTSTETSVSSNGSTVTVKDISVNIGGSIKLDGGSNSKEVDMNALLSNTQFVNQLKEMIKMSINNDMNGGRFMNDVSVMRGSTTNQTLYGKR